MTQLDDLKTYLGTTLGKNPDDGVLLSILATETADQAARLRADVVVALQPALTEALFRRVARNLAMRRIPLGISETDTEALRVSGRDSEVRRLEAPYRRLVVG